MKKLALLDFDNTIYRGYSIFDIIRAQEQDEFIKLGTWQKVKRQLAKYQEGKERYRKVANNILQIWAAVLEGKKYSRVQDYISNFFTNYPDKIFTWAGEVLPLLKGDYDILIVTTNYRFVVREAMNRFNIDGIISSQAGLVNGCFTGKVAKTMTDKKKTLHLFDDYSKENSLAIGDSENDIAILEEVEIPICFQPDEKLTVVAKRKDWIITDEDSLVEEIKSLLEG